MSKYTFLLPAYKSTFLDKALRSIQEQIHVDFKVLISDDCSPENIHDICEPYLNDTRFSYRRNENNMGGKSLVSHWNLLVGLCDTEYFIMASDDDIYDKEFLERINDLIDKHPRVDLYRARTRRVNGDGEMYEVDRLYDEKEEPLEFLYSSFTQDRVHCIGNYVFKTDALKRNGGFVDFPLAWFSDDATIFTCCTNGVANTSNVLFSFRSSQINISFSHRKDPKMALKKVEAACHFFDWMNTFVKEIPYSNTLYYNTLIGKVCKGYKDRIKWQIDIYYRQISFNHFIKLTRWMIGKKLLVSKKDISLFTIRWIKSQLL